MKGKLIFTKAEADEIMLLIKKKLSADSSEQKGIRNKIRNLGFYASDYGFRDGYTVEQFLSVAKIIGSPNKTAVSGPIQNIIIPTKSSVSIAKSRSLNMTFNDMDEIKKAGFTGFRKIGDLFLDSSMLPESNGVYLVINLDNRLGEFLTVGSGGYFKGKNPNVSLVELKANWLENTKVVYIGKATSLKSRLRQYFGFGQGRSIGHYGGRLIWQLKYSKSLVVCWKSLATDPREFEADLIRQFVSIYGCRPFANLQD